MDGAAITLGSPKQRAVLAVLLLRANEAVPREALISALWGEEPPKTAVTTLQVYVHGLRQALGHDRIETVAQAYRIRVAEDELDLVRFERLVAAARAALAEDRTRAAAAYVDDALRLWRGAPLADVGEVGELAASVRGLEERRLEAVELRNDVELALGRHDLVLSGIDGLIREHPYRERLRAQHILALYRSGRQTEALDAYHSVRAAWRDELGLEPTPALQELHRAVLRHDPTLAAPVPEAAPAWVLPAAATPIIGRRREIAAVSALVGKETRLVTLTGPGGTGKTRLALAIAEELAPGLPDGAVFVDLSAVSEPAFLVPTVAEAVGAPAGTATVDALAAHLAPLTVLLVLDNLEQILSAAPQIGELLSRAGRIRVLATSRAPLRLSAEQVYPVPPLPLPADAASPDEVARNEAVRLFAARARAVDPAFELDADAARDVTAVCRRLEGLPLAIELAAARTRVLSPAQLLERLPESLALLADGPSDAPPRHTTLEATIRWSFDLLAPDEREAFARLAVFAGGWTHEAAARCCGVGLDELTALVDHSLVRQRRSDSGRFAMLELVRQFAAQRLAEIGDDDSRRRHAEWIVELAEECDEAVTSSGDVVGSLDRLESERDNVRAALAWALDAGTSELVVRLGIALRQFWDLRGHLVEGRQWLDRILPLAHEVSDDLRLRLFAAAGKLAFHSGDFPEAERSYGEMLEVARSVGDDEAVARGLSDLGAVAAAQGDYDQAVELLGESADRFRSLGLGRRLALALANLGYVAGERKDYEQAREATLEALSLQRELTERTGEAVSLLNLGGLCVEEGDVDGARGWLRQCLALALELGYREVIVYAVVSLVRIARLEGDATRVAFLTGLAATLLHETGVGLLPAAQTSFGAATDWARAELGPDGFDAAHRDGESTEAADLLAPGQPVATNATSST